MSVLDLCVDVDIDVSAAVIVRDGISVLVGVKVVMVTPALIG